MPERVDAPQLIDADAPLGAAAVADVAEPPAEENAECPPPLYWQDVLGEVRRLSTAWRVERDGGVMTGRTLGDGPPVYVLPPTIGDWETFALLMWLLRDDFRVVVLEGVSPQTDAKRLPPGRLTADEAARDLFAVADSFGDDRFRLFATSSASLVAWQAMLAAPQRIERAVTLGAMPRVALSMTERLLLRLGRFAGCRFAQLPFFERLQSHNHRRWFPPFDETRWRFLLDNIGATPVAHWSRQLAALRRSDVAGSLSGIATPVLLLCGEGEGQAGKRRTDELAAALPHAQRELLPHCGRFGYLTHPHILAKRITTFFGIEG